MLKTLYVADGNETDLRLTEEAFKNDYRIFSAMSGSNLFSLLTKALPDMILLSAELPDMSGAEALSQLKEHDIYAQIPVIFLTDRPGITSEVFCLMNGAVDYIMQRYLRGHIMSVGTGPVTRTERKAATSLWRDAFWPSLTYMMRSCRSDLIKTQFPMQKH